MKKKQISPKPSDIKYWVESVTLLGTPLDLVTASMDSTEPISDETFSKTYNAASDATSDSTPDTYVVYCALRTPVASSGSSWYEVHLHDIGRSLRHAGSIQLTPYFPANHETVNQVMEYLAGHRRTFDLPLKTFGTPFQQTVWQELQKVPYGETQSYGELAASSGNPRAARAVGMANNRNPISLIIPCHRIIGKNGKLVGYGGGLDIKEKLLTLDQAP
jgi:methylated-DNA-[protein]-cysteine S-methyltransferase